jgi:L-galactose dehydrogenase
LEVSAISYGASSLGGEFGRIDRDLGRRAVHTALDLGINLIDVSPYYGRTLAEIVLGRILADIDRDRYLLSTKVGRYDVDFFDFSADRVTRSVDESLSRLHVDHIDLVHCHDIEFVHLQQIIDETIPALVKVREAGKVRHIGLAGYPLDMFHRVLAACGDEIATVISHSRYTLADQSLGEHLDAFDGAGLGVINAAPLGMGLLRDGGPEDWHPAPPAMRQAQQQAAAICRARGVDLGSLAMRFAIEQHRVASVMFGTDDPAIVQANVALADQPLDGQLVAEVRRCFEQLPCRTWPCGLPENADATD